MKKVAILAVTFLFAFTTLQVRAQENEKRAVKETKKELKDARKGPKSELKDVRKELKEDRKDLRKARRNQVSDFSKRQFETDFGKIPDARWSRTELYDKVVFTKDGKKQTAFYGDDFKLIAVSTFKTFSDLPPKGQSKIKKAFKDYIVGAIYYIDSYSTADATLMYYGIPLENDYYFVELTNGAKKILVRVDTNGYVQFYKQL